MMQIEAVIFDFGGVFTASPVTACEALGSELGTTTGHLSQIMFGPFGMDTDHPWHRLERGEIPLEQARTDILDLGKSQYNLEVDIYEFFARMPQDAGIRKELVERVALLKDDGYRTAIITNNIREFSDGWRSLLPVDELFDLIVDSSKEGIRKPDPAIFELTLQRLGELPPECTLFIDDFEANIEAANLLGMRTIHVKEDISVAIAELDMFLS